MSNQITKTLRDQMVDKAKQLAGIFDAKAAIEAERALVIREIVMKLAGGQRVWDELDALQAEMDKLVERVPEALKHRYTPDVAFAIDYAHLSLGGLRVGHAVHHCDLPKRRVWAPIDLQNLTLPADDPLVGRFFDLQNQWKAISSKSSDIALAVHNAIFAAERKKSKLLQMWPEAAELLPSPDKPDKPAKRPVTALTVQVESLNQLIGLPAGLRPLACG